MIELRILFALILLIVLVYFLKPGGDKMNKKELIEKLQNIKKKYNPDEPFYDGEAAHIEADALLLEYINDKDIEEIYDNIKKWYS